MSGQKREEWLDSALASGGTVALVGLAAIYVRAGLQRDLISNPNWTISNVMVYDYNLPITYFVLFPSFLTICIAYSAKMRLARVKLGAVLAIAGSLGLMLHPVTTHKVEHVFFALIIFASSGFWYHECTNAQFRRFIFSSMFFFGGFTLDLLLNGGGGAIRGRLPLIEFLPSVCCALGELGIFITWGQMTQKPTRGIIRSS